MEIIGLSGVLVSQNDKRFTQNRLLEGAKNGYHYRGQELKELLPSGAHGGAQGEIFL
jgi:hypothetical protein